VLLALSFWGGKKVESMKAAKVLSFGALAALVAAGGCYLDPPVVDYGNVPTPPEAVPLPDRVPEVVVDDDGYAVLSGQVKNWVSLEYVDGATLTTYGLANTVEGTAGADASFSLDVDVAGVFWVKAYKEGYEYTYDYVRMPNGDYQKTLYILSSADFDGMASAFGVTPVPDCGTVVAEIRNTANQGLANVANVALAGADYQGPYFLDANGQPDPNATYTSSSGRVVFFNVSDPGGAVASPGLVAQLSVVQEGFVQQQNVYLNIYPDAVTRGSLQVEPNGAPPPPPDPVVIEFADEIYPIIVGEACAACHAPDGPAAGSGLYLDGPAENVYAALKASPTAVNIQYPDQSYMLTKPLYEEPPNHPNASFPSVDHPDYKAILYWIEQGAPWGAQPPPDPVVQADFVADVYPVFQAPDVQNNPYGRDCAGCHDSADPDGGLDLYGDGQAGTVYQTLANYGYYDINYPDQSKILKYPYCGPTNCQAEGITHPVQVFAATDDPGYQIILAWVTTGAVYVGEPPPPEPVLEQNVDFFQNVMPRFARRGCTGCHDAQGAAGGLNLTGTPQQVYDAIYNVGQIVVPGDNEGSYLYTKPNAYFDQVNHGGPKQIPNEEDDYARYIGGWIYNDNAPFVDPGYRYLDQFATGQYFFQAQGCTGCHNAAGQANYGNLRLDLTGQDQIDELLGVYDADGQVRVVAGDPAASTIITKAWDLFPDVNHGGGKKQVYTYYREYNDFVTWVFEGANRYAP
jgi:mono/diheme cytochrome c family protein